MYINTLMIIEDKKCEVDCLPKL